MSRPLKRLALRRPCRFTALVLACMALAPATAGQVSWIDWYARTPTSVLGTLQQGNEVIQVSFIGEYSSAFTDALPEPYWGPASTYKSSAIENAPPRSDIIFIAGGSAPLKLTFSSPLVAPTFAIASLGLKSDDGSVSLKGSMEFNRDVSVLSNGPNYYASGLFSLFSATGGTLTGAESSGTVRLDGGGKELVWTSPLREETGGVLVGTYGFTIGVDCANYRIGPSTLTEASAVPGGCRGYNDRSFKQQAAFEVRGLFENRSGGNWVQGDDFTLTAAGQFENGARFIVGEGKTFTSRGQFRSGSSEGGGQFEVRGSFKLASNGAVNFGSFDLKGDNTGPASGRLLIDPGARFTSTGTVSFEQASRADVGGLFDNSGGQVFVDAADARLAVGTTGTLATSGRVTVGKGRLSNQGLVRVDSGGELLIKRPILGDATGTQFDNEFQLTVLTGGVLRVEGEPNPFAVTGFYGTVQNRAGATAQIDGHLALSGQFHNAGMVNLSRDGTMTLSGGFASFEQVASGQLQALGHIDVNDASRMILSGISHVAGVLQISQGTQVTVNPDGHLTFAPTGAALDSGFRNHGILYNKGKTSLVVGGAGASFEHINEGLIDNSGVFRIGRDMMLTDSGEIKNSGRFQVDEDGRLFITDQSVGFIQTPSGKLINNGTITTVNPQFVVFNGQISGSGTFDTPSTSFGNIYLAPQLEDDISIERRAPGLLRGTALLAVAATSFKPGTLRFTGDLSLDETSTVALRFSENGGNDRLIVDGNLSAAAGSRMLWLFAGGSAPGLDQVFTYFESPAGYGGGFTLETPDGFEVTDYALGTSPQGRQQRAVAFATPGSAEFTAQDLFSPHVFQGEQRYVGSALLATGVAFSNAGVLGLRNLPNSALEVISFDNQASGELLNSTRLTVDQNFVNQGLVKNRAGAEFLNLGRLNNESGARLENRGTLVNAPGGQITNRGEFVLIGDLRDDSTVLATGTQTVLNDGGHFDIQAGGRLLGQGEYEQRGAGAVTHVDGVLQAQGVLISEGSLTGSGRIESSLRLSQAAWLAPGNSVGTLHVDGDLGVFGAEVLIELASAESFDQLVVSGNAVLDGLVRFRLIDGYVPDIGDQWTWVTAGNSIGVSMDWQVEVDTGQSSYLLADANGLYDSQGLLPANSYFEFAGDRISLLQAPVPEPATWALWLAGLVGMRMLIRRVSPR